MTAKKNRVKSAKLGRNNIFKGGKTYSPSGVKSRQSVKQMSNQYAESGMNVTPQVNGREVTLFTKADELKSQDNIHITLSPSNYSMPAKSTKSRVRSGHHTQTFNGVFSPGNNAVHSVP